MMKCLLTSNTASEYCAPLTAFDWNEVDVSLIGTSSIDTTCTVWDVTTQQSVTQLIAHDAEVYDFAFAVRSTNVFASVGADGSVRLFDLRSLEHSTIVYEAPDGRPCCGCGGMRTTQTTWRRSWGASPRLSSS
eukprot:TRINITY_DN8314_c0_g1_i1.p3 TRINITY_DN8314_c0_g1~~TRINITY_DN8314_c0_g1_i1.p3  ORF type:complete len:133 (-),score=55.96 TRINITY_DN8314_c0_g1_i1:27-425(-)